MAQLRPQLISRSVEVGSYLPWDPSLRGPGRQWLCFLPRVTSQVALLGIVPGQQSQGEGIEGTPTFLKYLDSEVAESYLLYGGISAHNQESLMTWIPSQEMDSLAGDPGHEEKEEWLLLNTQPTM